MEDRDLLIRYGEIGTKGKNRREFEKALASRIRYALKEFEHGPVERPRGRIRVRNLKDPEGALEVVARLPGVISASIAVAADLKMEAIAAAAVRIVEEVLAGKPGEDPLTFKVDPSRSNKAFPLTSMRLAAELGAILLRRHGRLKARMKDPELRLAVEVRSKEALLSGVHRKGPGGLPVDTTGRVVVLLSGGIDSPVAAYMAMKRGARAVFINFHSYPFIPEASLDKIKAVVKALSVYQGCSRLYVAPFSEIQVAVKRHCPEELRTVLYRRMMMRLAERAAEEEGALALVTGECLGQVASQTLENIRCIGAAASLPVLRPLIGFDKTQSVGLAQEIGTYEISIQPHPDCCTVFQPRRPRIRATLAEVESAEAHLDVDGLVEAAYGKVRRLDI